MTQSASHISSRRVILDGAIGVGAGAVAVMLISTLDLFGLATLVQQTDQPMLYVALMLFKPTMLTGVLAVGYSVRRH